MPHRLRYSVRTINDVVEGCTVLRIERYENGYAVCEGSLWLFDNNDGRLYAEDGAQWYKDPRERAYPDDTGAVGYALTAEEYEAAVAEAG